MHNTIEFTGLGKRYGQLVALQGITAAVPAGRVIGLLGHNGAGKSTLIKLILGLIAPSAGSVSVLGQPPWGAHAGALRQRIGYLPENVAFYGNLTGRELLDYLAALKRAPRAQVPRLLERVGLAAAAERRIATYSKGMRQRLGLAQALLGAPELVLLDEPTTGLDPQATAELYQIVGELRADGRCVLICSHLLAELEPHIDGALVLREGELLAAGSLTELRDQAALPHRLLVRLAPRADVSEALARLDALAPGAFARTDGQLQAELPHERKMPVLRELAGDPAVANIDLREPGLAQLYDWLGAGRRTAPEHAA
jgi:Cu-processing system ATP-binding protein